MMAAEPDALRARAERLAAAIGSATVLACQSAVGGGSLPGETLPSFAVALGDGAPTRAGELARRLRQGTPPVIGRIAGDRLLLDVRTVLEEQEEALIGAIRDVFRNG
jgi:L-seryl-tRNA(Ser) seleniumtransferase